MLLADLVGRAVGDDPALAHQQQPVTPLRLVHDVAGDEDGAARVRQAVEELPQVAAQHRVQAHRRLVEYEQVGVAEQGDSEAGTAALASREAPDHLVAVVTEGHRVDGLADRGAADAEDAGEEGEVLRDREVVVDAGGLGDVADPGPQRRAARGLAQHLDRSRADLLRADEAPHQRGLAAPARPEQARHAGRHVDRDPGQHLASTAYDDEVAHRYDVIHHVLNCAPGVAPGSRGSGE